MISTDCKRLTRPYLIVRAMGDRKNTQLEKSLSMDTGSRESFNTYMSSFLLDQKPSETPGPGHILHLNRYRRKRSVSGWATDPVLSWVCHYCKGFLFSSSRVGWTVSSPFSTGRKGWGFEINVEEFGPSGNLQGLCPEA